ncbi:MAG: hypothetical protein KAG61_00360, partial [Bacteriovoracaceae bacterium]|nr:hypothetical protein [Bacteriovoracaceae bacterium]
SKITVYAIDRNPSSDPICGNIATVTSKDFTYTVNPIGATHGGWTKISAFGPRKDRFDNVVSFNGQSTAYVDLAWSNFTTLNSGTGTAQNISGWHLFRRKTNEEYDFDTPITEGITIPANVLSYQDVTVSENTVYYYLVRPIDSSPDFLTIPTEEVFSEIRIFVPGKNTAFIHRWMMNKEVCSKMLADIGSSNPLKNIDPVKSFRCRYEGAGEVLDPGPNGVFNLIGDADFDDVTYYDIGHDLLVDVTEIGCPYTNNTDEPNCSVNGCIGTDQSVVTPSSVNSIFYNRSSGACYRSSGAAWEKMDTVALYAATYVDKATNVYLPPLVNISQENANKFCKARTDVVGDGLKVADQPKYALPSRLEQIAYSAWSSDYLYTSINELEEGQFLNASSKCNSSAASGIEDGYSEAGVPPTSYLYSLPGTRSSQIRSIYTGSQMLSTNELTSSCISRYGIQDVYGNVAEWTLDRFSCHPEDTPTPGYSSHQCDALTESVDADLIIDGLYGASKILTAADNSKLNYYRVVDSFYDHYVMNGSVGPCNDATGNDGVCDAPLSKWILYKESFSAGSFSFPVGLPIDKDYINNSASTPSNYVLQIGSTSGIKSDDFHNDTVSFDTYSISQEASSLGGVAGGGSYLTTSDAGRYSMELIPITDVTDQVSSGKLGSNYLLPGSLADSEFQFAYVNLGD